MNYNKQKNYFNQNYIEQNLPLIRNKRSFIPMQLHFSNTIYIILKIIMINDNVNLLNKIIYLNQKSAIIYMICVAW